jgi:hypothetical protein
MLKYKSRIMNDWSLNEDKIYYLADFNKASETMQTFSDMICEIQARAITMQAFLAMKRNKI